MSSPYKHLSAYVRISNYHFYNEMTVTEMWYMYYTMQTDEKIFVTADEYS